MFGFIRFALACIVLLNHLKSNMPIDLAVSAVVIFYLISGYTMGIKFNKYLVQTSQPTKLFLYDRILRVFPLFILVMITTIFLGDFFKVFDFGQIFLNLSLLPLNFYMFFYEGTTLPITYKVLPIAYSLALEEQFYLIMPFLLSAACKEKLLKKIVVFSSLFISICIILAILTNFSTYFAILFGNTGMAFFTDYLVYRLLPGTIIIFILGICLNYKTNLEVQMTKFIGLFYLLLLLIVSLFSIADRGQIFAVIIGILVGIPLVLLAKELSRTKIDDFFGSLSYPIFLIQDPTKLFIESNFKFEFEWQYNLACVALTLLISLIVAKTIEHWLSIYRANFSKNFILKHPIRN